MDARTLAVMALVNLNQLWGAVYSYEADAVPIARGWSLLQDFCNPDEWIRDNTLVHVMDFCPDYDPPVGQQFDYTKSFDEFLGVEAFFAEWRIESSGDRIEIPYVAPAALVLFNHGSVHYHFTIAKDLAKLNRDNLLPIVFVGFAPGIAHTYRLELDGSEWYAWYIDGVIVDEGIPEGSLTSGEPSINFRSKAKFVESVTMWYYIRYGHIPDDGSGDFDSDGDHDLRDFYFLHECLVGVDRPVLADGDVDPGCLWADMNEDQVVDLLDFAEFQIAHSNNQ